MQPPNPLRRAIESVGLRPLSSGLGVTYQAVLKWEKRRRMPRTEWTGETNYSERIAQLTGQAVTREQLLAKWPQPEPAPAAPPQGDQSMEAAHAG